MRSFLFLCFVLEHFWAVCHAQCFGRDVIVISGNLICYDKPVPHTKIKLIHMINFVPNQIGVTVSDANGYFKIAGVPRDVVSGEQKQWKIVLAVQFLYEDLDEKVFGIDPWHMETTKVGSEGHDFGDLPVDGRSCDIYLKFLTAIQDYKQRLDENPGPFHILGSENVSTRVPYVEWVNVVIPEGFEVTEEVAKHELGHIIRNRLDGPYVHFQEDRKKYSGYDSHRCRSKTSLEFAFSEGWALYWAGQCIRSDANGEKDVEGNVAEMLRNLQARCDTSDHDMVNVLQENPKRIHTYDEFEKAHQALRSCP